MRWFFLVIAVFGLCGAVAIAYWRQTGVDVSIMSMFLALILLPSLIIGCVVGFDQFRKWRKKLREETDAAALQDADQPVMLAEGSAAPWLHVYATAIQTQQGDHADKILLNLQQLQAAECDPELLHFDGTRLLSRRVDLDVNDAVDQDVNHMTNQPLSARAIRIQHLSQNIYGQLNQTLSALAEGMSETQVRQQPSASRQAILHPAWQGKNVENKSSHPFETETVLSWPKVIKILYLLPTHLDEDEQTYLQQKAYSDLIAYGFQPEQVQWTDQIVEDSDQTLQVIGNELTKQLASTESSILLLIGADSAIDQDFLDQMDTDHQRYIPAEASFGWLMTNESSAIADLPVLARLTAPILSTRQKSINAGGRIAADALIASIDELRRIYKVSEFSLIPDSGVLVSDVNTMRSQTLRELTLALNPFDLPSEQVVYAGSLLEDMDSMMSGLALTVALQQAESSQQHVPVFSSSGNTLRGAWLAAPFIPIYENEEFTVVSEDI